MSLVICDTNVFISAFNGLEKTTAELYRIGSENVLMPSLRTIMDYKAIAIFRQIIRNRKKFSDPEVAWVQLPVPLLRRI